ncbi:hypothetical protein [Singulisphaera sp. PoT]|uniref:hypothetical protein n=1 Tax=Singulisphaera sp. PoT TaxID=3411797 RepID=UPI003BF48583
MTVQKQELNEALSKIPGFTPDQWKAFLAKQRELAAKAKANVQAAALAKISAAIIRRPPVDPGSMKIDPAIVRRPLDRQDRR